MSTALARISALAFLLAIFLTAPTPAESPIEVSVTQPSPFEAVFGEVEVVAEITAERPLQRVIFLVDGIVAGRLQEPPFRLVVDVGQDNLAHVFEVVAEDVDGNQGRGEVDTPALRVDLSIEARLQELYVTVTRDGRRALDLGQGDFQVLDEGLSQKVVTFARGDVPFTALILVDSSASMRGRRIAAALEGARAFVRGMQPLDQAKLLLTSDRVLHSTPFTNFSEVLTAGLAGVKPRGATALNDHLYLGLKLLEGRSGREVVILLSDGIDTASVLDMSRVMPLVRRSQAQIYWIRPGAARVRQDRISSWRTATEHRRELELLEQAVERSGGRVVALASITEAPDAFREILDELREQYVLGFYPSADRGDQSFHEVEVKIRRSGHNVRTSEGYVDF